MPKNLTPIDNSGAETQRRGFLSPIRGRQANSTSRRCDRAILDDPAPHIGRIYDLTQAESTDLDHYAQVFSEVLGRPIQYRDLPIAAWADGLRMGHYPEHAVRHMSAIAQLTRDGRYDSMTDALPKLVGQPATSLRAFVKLHAADYT